MADVAENTSGQGKEAVLPDELKGLSWGAFLMGWIWGIGNRVWISFLEFVPIANVVMPFVLLFKGNEWAWAKKEWEDVDHFRRVQRRWTQVGLGLWGVVLVLITGATVWGMMAIKNSEPFIVAMDTVRKHPASSAVLGQPVEPSFLVGGEIKVSGPKGNADLSFGVSGPKGKGRPGA